MLPNNMNRPCTWTCAVQSTSHNHYSSKSIGNTTAVEVSSMNHAWVHRLHTIAIEPVLFVLYQACLQDNPQLTTIQPCSFFSFFTTVKCTFGQNTAGLIVVLPEINHFSFALSLLPIIDHFRHHSKARGGRAAFEYTSENTLDVRVFSRQ